jgi:hypothetical protein
MIEPQLRRRPAQDDSIFSDSAANGTSKTRAIVGDRARGDRQVDLFICRKLLHNPRWHGVRDHPHCDHFNQFDSREE